MKYYLIYLQYGKVIDICSYDDKQTRDTIYRAWLYRNQNAYRDADFDQLQCFPAV
jgi:hypothetical protein